jgi:uncharacterized protein (DUF1501 family)
MALTSLTRRTILASAGAVFAFARMPRPARAEAHEPRFLAIVLRGALDGAGDCRPSW